jgi:hypothetical protein
LSQRAAAGLPAIHGTATAWWRGLDPLERLGHRDDVGVPLGLHWTGDEDGEHQGRLIRRMNSSNTGTVNAASP